MTVSRVQILAAELQPGDVVIEFETVVNDANVEIDRREWRYEVASTRRPVNHPDGYVTVSWTDPGEEPYIYGPGALLTVETHHPRADWPSRLRAAGVAAGVAEFGAEFDALASAIEEITRFYPERMTAVARVLAGEEDDVLDDATVTLLLAELERLRGIEQRAASIDWASRFRAAAIAADDHGYPRIAEGFRDEAWLFARRPLPAPTRAAIGRALLEDPAPEAIGRALSGETTS